MSSNQNVLMCLIVWQIQYVTQMRVNNLALHCYLMHTNMVNMITVDQVMWQFLSHAFLF